MHSVTVTFEYGLIVRKAALVARGIPVQAVLQALETDRPLDSNETLLSFGPCFGAEAMNEFATRLQSLGLVYVEDFFTLACDLPSWCETRIGLRT